MKPVLGGTYRVNDRMVEDLKNAVNGEHASNLGAVIARNIGDEIGAPSLVVDPVAVDEMEDVARITGSPDPKPLFWDCKYRHIFYFRTFSCGKNHIWLKKRLRYS